MAAPAVRTERIAEGLAGMVREYGSMVGGVAYDDDDE